MESWRTKILDCCRQRGPKFAASMLCIVIFCYVVDFPHLIDTVPVAEQLEGFPIKPTCGKILSDASLPKTENPWFVVNDCKLHKYSPSDAQTCMYNNFQHLGRNHIAFVGDLHIQNLYAGLRKLLDCGQRNSHTQARYVDFRFPSNKLHTLVSFRFLDKMDSVSAFDYTTWGRSPFDSRPSVIIQGAPQWDPAPNVNFNISSRSFKANLSAVLPLMHKVAKTTDIIWMLQDTPDPVRTTYKKDAGVKEPLRADTLNKMVVELLSSSPVYIWSSGRKVDLRFAEDTNSGEVYSSGITEYKLQLFLNWYCNRYMEFTDSTCCDKPRVYNRKYIILRLSDIPIGIVVLLLSLFCCWTISGLKFHRTKPVPSE